MKRKYSSPLEAFLEGYLSGMQELLLEASEDWDKIVSDRNEDIFIGDKSREASSSYLSYANIKCKTNFADISSFDEWMKGLPMQNSWEETSKGLELSGEIKKIEADLKVLKTAEESGASDAVMTALKQVMGGVYHRKNSLEKEVRSFREEFESNALMHKLLIGSHESYDRFRGVAERSERRSESGVSLPFLIYSAPDENSVYFCSINKASNLEIYIKGRIEALLDLLPASLGNPREVGVPYVAGFFILPQSNEFLMPNKSSCDFLDEKNVLRGLGIKFSPVCWIYPDR